MSSSGHLWLLMIRIDCSTPPQKWKPPARRWPARKMSPSIWFTVRLYFWTTYQWRRTDFWRGRFFGKFLFTLCENRLEVFAEKGSIIHNRLSKLGPLIWLVDGPTVKANSKSYWWICFSSHQDENSAWEQQITFLLVVVIYEEECCSQSLSWAITGGLLKTWPM